MSSLTLESVSNHLTLLKEQDVRLKVMGLKKLDRVIHHHWHEISDHLAEIEALYESEQFPEKELAASIISKVYYHLEEYTEAVNYALESGQYFNLNERNQYNDTLVGKCIDRYISQRQKNFEAKDPNDIIEINKKLENVIEKIFERSINEKEFTMGLGVALDSRRIDKIEKILEADQYSSEVLDYLTKTSLTYVKSRSFRIEVLKIVVTGFGKRQKNFNDYVNLAQALFLLGDHKTCAELLFELIRYDDNEKECLAYQIATDLNENENSFFISRIIKELNKIENPTPKIGKARDNVTKILKGTFKDETYLRFFKVNNQTDPAIIAHLKQTIDAKNSVAHSGCLVANSFLNAKTTDHSFLTNNLEWVAKATNWAKFSATASLGSIHQGNYTKAMEILNPYFPGNQATPSWYTHGGSLYGLGLIHAGDRDQDIVNFILSALKNPAYNSNENLIHGACLGLGLVNLGSCDEEDNLTMYEELKNVLFTDSAATGEAAGLAIGLTMMGSANQYVIQDLLGYAHETQHEKIIRSIAMALALITYGKEEGADALIDQLCLDKDPILRYGGMYMIGLAYVATSNNNALKKLLHYAVSDVSDDVRRAAVLNIGYLMLKDFNQVPKIVHLLSGSFNSHVRYGSTIALGISCAGTCNQEALKLLEPMLNDAVEFVRQGAFIATAMILQQANSSQEPRVEKFRKTLDEIINKKHEDPLVRLGVLISTGIIDAGGRNANISLLSQFGYPKMMACAGMTIFTHFWYWYPLVQFFSLTLAPSGLIGVNKDLRIPKGFQFKSNAKPSLFDYPAHIKPDDKKKQEKKETVQLSITQKAKARAAKKNADKEGEPAPKEEKMDVEEKPEKEEEEKKKDEPPFKIAENFTRVLPKQQEVVIFLDDNRYTPILKNRKRGILFLNDTKSGEKEEFVDAAEPTADAHLVPPEAFDFDEEAQLTGKK